MQTAETEPRLEDAIAASAVLTRARLTMHRVSMPAIAARQVAARVRSCLASLVDRDGRSIAATVGVAVRQPAEPWQHALERADAAMYAGKEKREGEASDGGSHEANADGA